MGQSSASLRAIWHSNGCALDMTLLDQHCLNSTHGASAPLTQSRASPVPFYSLWVQPFRIECSISFAEHFPSATAERIDIHCRVFENFSSNCCDRKHELQLPRRCYPNFTSILEMRRCPDLSSFQAFDQWSAMIYANTSTGKLMSNAPDSYTVFSKMLRCTHFAVPKRCTYA